MTILVNWYVYTWYACTQVHVSDFCFVSQFMQDAQEVMDMLVKVQNDQGEMEPDDPQVKPQGRDIYVEGV